MTRSILVLPGGAYRHHAPHEGEPVAEWLRTLGWDARVVTYPVLTRHPEPLRFVQREVLRERETHDTVGVLGFSAGGHLAGLTAVTPDAAAGERPDLSILCYPVVSMLTPTHKVSRENLIGPRASWWKRRAVSLEKLVRPSSPPMFIWHTGEDDLVPVEHSYLLGSALAKHGVPHDLHVFADGGHGIGFGADLPAAAWRALAERWLQRF